MAERIHVGIGGWTFEPWRDNFYPAGLPQKQELHYASRKLTAIEINGTFYSRFKREQYAKWRDETPDGFVFSLKAHRFTTHRKVLATAGEGIANFVATGIDELGDKLGPIVWQLMPNAKFDPADLDAFLQLLPREAGGRPLRHVLDVRHESFQTEQYFALLAKHGATSVCTDSDKYPMIAHAGSDLAYLRLMRTESEIPTGYAEPELKKWVEGAKAWTAQGPTKEAFVYFISGAKERAPHAAMKFIELL